MLQTIRVICSDKNGMHQESETGIFADTGVSSVRDYRYGGPGNGRLPVINLDPDIKYQEIIGFGGSFTDATCYLLNTLDPETRRSVMNNLFSETGGIGLNIGRLTVAQCDFGRVVYSYNDTPDDIDMKNFSIKYDLEYIIPVIRQALDTNPDMYLLSSPWSPPGWMKTGGLMTGGWMRAEYLGAFANYYLRYLQEYAKQGIRINALTTQNETETDQHCLMPACFWHPDLEIAFIRDHLAPLLEKNGMGDIAIWLMDHNYIMWRRAKWMLDAPGLRPLVRGVAFHPYEGHAEVMTRLHDMYPDIDMHMTEAGSVFDPSLEGVLRNGTVFTDALRNWSRSIFCWNIARDEANKPNIGPFFKCGQEDGGAILQIHSKTREVRYGGQYWALGHFSRHIKRGARRIASECDMEGIKHVGFVNPDGGYVVILVNTGAPTEVSLTLKDGYAQIPITENSLTTLIFN